MRDDAITVLKSEFALWGIKFTHSTLNSGHVEIVWRATPDKETRRYILPKTPGDWRGPLNARSKIRQLFKADGLKLPEIIKKKPPAIQKALALPVEVETDAQQIKMLRGEIGDLTEMVFELSSIITTMRDQLAPARPPEIVAPPTVPALPVKKTFARNIKTIEHVSVGWTSTEAIAKSMGLTKAQAYAKLYYLLKAGKVELIRGDWRKKPAKFTVAAE